MTAAFQEFQQRQQQLAEAEKNVHLQRVKQSLRPHNTPEWFNVGLYIKEWFFQYPDMKDMFIDAPTLHGDIEARFPRTGYDLDSFRAMLKANYESCPNQVVFRFVKEDFFAAYEHAHSFQEIDSAKALPAPAWLVGMAMILLLTVFSSCQKIFDDQPHCYVCTTHDYTVYPSTAIRRDTCSVTDAQIEQYELHNDKQPYSRIICNFKN